MVWWYRSTSEDGWPRDVTRKSAKQCSLFKPMAEANLPESKNSVSSVTRHTISFSIAFPISSRCKWEYYIHLYVKKYWSENVWLFYINIFVFFRHALFLRRTHAATVIQASWRCYIARKKYLLLRKTIIAIQVGILTLK